MRDRDQSGNNTSRLESATVRETDDVGKSTGPSLPLKLAPDPGNEWVVDPMPEGQRPGPISSNQVVLII